MLLGAATLALGSCCTSRVSNDIKKDTAIHGVEADMDAAYLTLSDAQRDIVARNNDFGLRLFKNVSGMDSRVVSPLSVTYLMGMLANGADGQTRQEILTTLGWDKGAEGQNALEEANELACMMLQSLSRQDKAITVDVANFVAVNNQVKLKEGFQRTVTDYYKAGVEALDFASPKALKRINGRCSDRTHGMIPSIIDQTNPQDVSYLMNAIYFNGSWTDKFVKTRVRRNINFTADNRLYPLLFTGSVKVNDAVHYTVVGNGKSSLSLFLCRFHKFVYSACSVKQAVFGMIMKMCKSHSYSPHTFAFILPSLKITVKSSPSLSCFDEVMIFSSFSAIA